MKTLILGLGSSGKSAADLLLSQGKEVIGVDRHPFAVSQESRFPTFLDTAFFDFSEVDLVVVSPGISREHPLYREALDLGIEVVGEAELSFRFLRQPCIAITGTNGKTTVTLLVEHVLRSAGIKARALGNIGAPLCHYCLSPNPEEILVIELSSYQLETMVTPIFDAGVILNITPDHLDRYASMEEYAATKCHLQSCLKEDSILYVHRDVLSSYAHLLKEESVNCYGCEIFFLQDAKGLGRHDKDNILAAWALVREYGVTETQFLNGLKTFKKPPHRIEFIAEIDGVSYYDDSKGTNIDAVLRAVDTMEGATVLIAGGVDKGASYVPWKVFQDKVKTILVIGEAADKLLEELQGHFSMKKVASFEEAVREAAVLTTPGDCVLLSPGCASFDMFRDYAHRGEEFKRHVYDLQERRIKG